MADESQGARPQESPKCSCCFWLGRSLREQEEAPSGGAPWNSPGRRRSFSRTHPQPPSNALTSRTNKTTKEKEFRVPTPAWESWSELRPSSFKTSPILPSGCSAPPAIHMPQLRPATLRAFPQQDATALHTKEDACSPATGQAVGAALLHHRAFGAPVPRSAHTLSRQTAEVLAPATCVAPTARAGVLKLVPTRVSRALGQHLSCFLSFFWCFFFYQTE